MKNFGLVLGSALLFAAPALAETSAFNASASVSFNSDYMWRGFNLYDGSSIQPSISVDYDTGYGTVGGNVWSHLSAEGGTTNIDKFTEIDYTLTYALALDPIAVKVGHLWYTYPKDSDNLENTAEIFASVVIDDEALGSPFPLSPTLSAYHDYDLVDGQYYELGISHTFEPKGLGDGFNFTPYAAFGFAEDQTPVYAANGFVQSTFGVSTSLSMGDVAVTPSLNYTAEADENLKNEFWFGMTFGYTF
jgi:hypothetical protein